MIVEFHPDVKNKDLKNVDFTVKNFFIKAIDKIKQHPDVWKSLKSPLWSFKKVYFFNKKWRIVYKFDGKRVYVIAVWKRENKLVYKNALKRIL